MRGTGIGWPLPIKAVLEPRPDQRFALCYCAVVVGPLNNVELRHLRNPTQSVIEIAGPLDYDTVICGSRDEQQRNAFHGDMADIVGEQLPASRLGLARV